MVIEIYQSRAATEQRLQQGKIDVMIIRCKLEAPGDLETKHLPQGVNGYDTFGLQALISVNLHHHLQRAFLLGHLQWGRTSAVRQLCPDALAACVALYSCLL